MRSYLFIAVIQKNRGNSVGTIDNDAEVTRLQQLTPLNCYQVLTYNMLPSGVWRKIYATDSYKDFGPTEPDLGPLETQTCVQVSNRRIDDLPLPMLPS